MPQSSHEREGGTLPPQTPYQPGGVADSGRVGLPFELSVRGGGLARPITPADVPGLLALISTCYAEYGLTLRVEQDEPHLVDPGAYFSSHGGCLWVVDHDGGIGASVGVLVGGREAELKTLYVHPQLRHRGLGTALTWHVIDHARAARCRRLVLWSDTRFVAAHRLYARLGFTQLPGDRPLFDSNDSREYPFEVQLAPQPGAR
ncbi:MAG: GNAT family N-acetyltransferase [Phycisphaerales bacterium]|nr:MAG: GNAT family N-acetyltransferase [Phycisphaerales bacterium]